MSLSAVIVRWGLVLLAALPARPAYGLPLQDSSAGRGIHLDTLANGLEVIVVEDDAAPIATVMVAVRTGAFTQSPGEQGIAHLFEHVLFRSYGGDPTEFSREAAKLNAAYNGTTAVDVVTYYLQLPSKEAKGAIRLLGRLMSRTKFDEADLAQELPVVLDEMARIEANPDAAFVRRMSSQLWGDDWYRRDIGGDSTVLSTITVEQLRKTFERYYIPNNAVLIVTGDVTWEEVLEEADDHFDDWDAGAPPLADGAELYGLPPLSGLRALAMYGFVRNATIRVSVRGPGLRTDSSSVYAADALSTLLNMPKSTFRRELLRTGLFYSVHIAHEPTVSASPITIEATTAAESIADAVRMLVDAIDQMDMLFEVSEDDFALVSKRREVGAALALEYTPTLAPALAEWWAGPGIDAMISYSSRVAKQTADDMSRFINRYVSGAPKVVGVLGPPDAIDRFAAAVRGEPNR
jgi:zinc protease